MTAYAPIALFVYNRPEHTRRTVEALASNRLAAMSDLVIFSDGPKSPRDEARVEAVRDYVSSIGGFASVRRTFRDSNLGLAQSIIGGVSEILSQHDRVVVLEDDLLLSPHFLRYMNDGLARYADEPRVASIHGYSYPTKQALPETFFLRGADCWGWGTWSRAWNRFEPDGAVLLQALRNRALTRDFDLDGAYPYTRMLQKQIAGLNDSWAIRWHARCYLDGSLTLYPGRSLVHNIGTDSSGTHGDATDAFDTELASRPIDVAAIPIEPSRAARDAFARFLRRQLPLRARMRHIVHDLVGR